MRSGRLIGSDCHVLENAADESLSGILTSFMLQYYSEESLPPQEILLNADVEDADVLAQLLSERRGGKVTYAAINGYNGKMVADFPISSSVLPAAWPRKVWLMVRR